MIADVKAELGLMAGTVKRQGMLMLGLLALMWLLELVDTGLLRQSLNQYGIVPRTAGGLRGLLFAPFLHVNLTHLAANSLPFLALGWLVLAHSWREFAGVTIGVAALSGLGAWLFGGANSVHIGASGVIFGWFGFLLFHGLFTRHLGQLVVSLLVGLVYGSLFWGVLPVTPGVSWQGHLFGFVGGALMAWINAQIGKPAVKP
jgi:membrane associated rhomboid family serine protease